MISDAKPASAAGLAAPAQAAAPVVNWDSVPGILARIRAPGA